MNVRITYGMELKEIPSKIKGMLESPRVALSALDEKIKLSQNLLTQEAGRYCEVVPDMIDDVRKELATVDERLSEIYMILDGYTRAMAPQPAPQPQAPPQPTPSAHPPSPVPSNGAQPKFEDMLDSLEDESEIDDI